MSFSLEDFRKQKGLVFSAMNCRSFEGKREQVYKILGRSNVLCLNETWLKSPLNTGMLNIPGRVLYRHDRTHKKAGGVAISVTSNLARYCTSVNELTIITEDYEAISILLSLPGEKQMLIVSIYRIPKKNAATYKQFIDFLKLVANYQNAISNGRHETWILGDINLNMNDDKCNGSEQFRNLCKDMGWKILITATTRPFSGTCIDNIVTNSPRVTKSGILGALLSDHVPVFARRGDVTFEAKSAVYKGRDYRGFKEDNFLTHLRQYNWGNFFDTNDPNVLWDMFVQPIDTYLNKHCPYIERVIKDRHKSWMTEEIMDAIFERETSLNLYRVERLPEQKAAILACRRRIDSMSKASKKGGIVGELDENYANPRRFWKHINQLFDCGGEVIYPDLKNIDTGDTIATDDAAKYINDYFSGIGEKLHTKIVGQDQKEADNLDRVSEADYVAKGIPKLTISKWDVHFVIKDLDKHKSSGIEGIRCDILISAMLCLIDQFTHLCQTSVDTGIFPSKWGDALVKPIPKDGDLSDVRNWRPISLLPVTSKVLEKVIYNFLSEQMTLAGCFSDNQYGYKRGAGTGDATYDLVNDLYGYRNDGLIGGALFVDFTKAFDSVIHSKLLNKIADLGLEYNNFKWFESYLDNRSQRTTFAWNISESKKVTYGVPQGSVLGPLLFVLYIDNVTKALSKAKIKLYADDIVIYYGHKDMRVVTKVLEEESMVFANWVYDNRLTINPKKTEYMWLGSKHKLKRFPDTNISFYGQKVKTVQHFPYLGVTIDSSLSFDKQVKLLKRNICNKLFRFAAIRKWLNRDYSILIYKCTIRPILEYCSFITTSCNEDGLQQLQRLQNRALRVCLKCNIRKYHVDELHEICGIELVQRRMDKLLLSLMYTRAQKLEDGTNDNLGDHDDNLRAVTRARAKIVFRLPALVSHFYKRSPYYRGIVLWNTLSAGIQRATSKVKFKVEVDKIKDLRSNLKKGYN